MTSQKSTPSILNSTASSSSGSTQKRIKLTLKPLKASASIPPSAVDSPSDPSTSHGLNSNTYNETRRIHLKPIKVKSSHSNVESEVTHNVAREDERKPVPKIRIKPLKAETPQVDKIEDHMDVDQPEVALPTPPMTVQSEVQVSEPVEVLTPLSRASRPPPPPKPKIPRPIKLKPLKEVLARLITQIKRKDDYAFFLQPVDASQVPGYTDVVKNPMDLGTMTEKVESGKYRSLEQFKDDFLLVTSNAKTFNPPSTLYHTEAAKLESWGLDQIARAASQVIEYETDWTIDVVADEEPVPISGEMSGGVGSHTLISEAASRGRSPSVVSSATGLNAAPVERLKRRGKKIPIVTESWEEGGHLPGFKDGIGMFPPCSDLADLMLELKLKGKRFRTKKERLKREKEGPPFSTDGSLDYFEMEQPFSVLQQLVPPSLTVPQLIPVLANRLAPSDTLDLASSVSQTPEIVQEYPEPTYIPPSHIATILSDPDRYSFTTLAGSSSQIRNTKLRHWTINRNPPRSRIREDEEDGTTTMPQTKKRRLEPSDYGSFASLLGTLAIENGLKADDFENFFGGNEKILDLLRQSIASHDKPSDELSPLVSTSVDRDQLLSADEYIRDVVYGGVDGLAYFRSLAEFVGDQCALTKKQDEMESGELGIPLAKWVEENMIDPITGGNHKILQSASRILSRVGDMDTAERSELVADYLTLSNADKSTLRHQKEELESLTDPDAQIDMAPLLRAPEELFIAEAEWAGRDIEAQGQGQAATGMATVNRLGGGTIAEPVLGSHSHTTPTVPGLGPAAGTGVSNWAAIEEALTVGAKSLEELARRVENGDSGAVVDDALERRTRLTLIALAKRAPIDRIARLPPELVPPHIRHIVPTLGT